MKEIRAHIKSVEQTLKITNAMYLISSSNLQRAKRQLNEVYPYFQKIYTSISDIVHLSPVPTHIYFDQRSAIPPEERKVGCIVVTGDKGLAGAYNHNVLKLAEQWKRECPQLRLFVVGQAGRVFFQERGISIEENFAYTAYNPNMHRAREISDQMVRMFRDGELDEISIIYTEMVTALKLEVRKVKLLPLDPNNFPRKEPEPSSYVQTVTYMPSADAVLTNIIPGYVKGMIFGGLVESFCSEQNARMSAMESSSDNAREMLKGLSLTYNRARQAAITQEISEVAGGTQASRNSR